MELKKTSEISLLLTDNQEIRSLNKQYRKIDTATDVLAFSFLEGEEKNPLLEEKTDELLLGDIVISVETAKTQAEQWGHTLQHEITILLVHGLLHLLGFVHVTNEDREKMKLQENKILGSIGYLNQRTSE